MSGFSGLKVACKSLETWYFTVVVSAKRYKTSQIIAFVVLCQKDPSSCPGDYEVSPGEEKKSLATREQLVKRWKVL